MTALTWDGDAREIQRASEDYWRREYFRREAGKAVEATCLDSATDSTGAQKVLLESLGLIVDYRGAMPLAAGESAEVKLLPTGCVA